MSYSLAKNLSRTALFHSCRSEECRLNGQVYETSISREFESHRQRCFTWKIKRGRLGCTGLVRVSTTVVSGEGIRYITVGGL